MANIYDGADSGMYSVAPPPAPMGRGGSRMSPIGRRRRQFHPSVLSKLPQNHPIFKVLPQLRNIVAAHRGGPPHPGPGGGPTQEPDPYHTGWQQQPPPPVPTAQAQPGTASTPPWMNIPKDLTGLGDAQWGDPQTQYNAPDPEDQLRERLMQRFHTAAPQAPALTSRRALNHFVGQHQKRRVGNLARQPMLPLRRPQKRQGHGAY